MAQIGSFPRLCLEALTLKDSMVIHGDTIFKGTVTFTPESELILCAPIKQAFLEEKVTGEGVNLITTLGLKMNGTKVLTDQQAAVTDAAAVTMGTITQGSMQPVATSITNPGVPTAAALAQPNPATTLPLATTTLTAHSIAGVTPGVATANPTHNVNEFVLNTTGTTNTFASLTNNVAAVTANAISATARSMSDLTQPALTGVTLTTTVLGSQDVASVTQTSAAMTPPTTGNAADLVLVNVPAVGGAGATTAQEGIIDDNFKDIASTINNIVTEVGLINTELAQGKTFLDEVKSDFDGAVTDITALNNDNTATKNLTDELKTDFSLLFADVGVLFADRTAAKTTIAALEAEVADAEAILNSVVAEQAKLLTWSGNVDTQLTQVINDFGQNNAELNKVEAALNDVIPKLNTAIGDIGNLDQEVQDTATAMTAVEGRVSNVISDLTDLDGQVVVTQTKLAEIDTQFTAAVADLTALDAQVDAAVTDVAALKTQGDATVQDIGLLNTQMGNISADLNELRNQLNDLLGKLRTHGLIAV